MSIYSTAMIQRFELQGEQEFSVLSKCIISRDAFTIVAGTSTYQLDDSVRSIRRITWKGVKLEPISFRRFREQFGGGSTSTPGQPYWYIYNNIGTNKVQFYPTPNESIASTGNNLDGIEIERRVIIECAKIANGVQFTIPVFLKRRLLKSYVLSKCFSVENQGQNLKAAKYFAEKFQLQSEMYNTLLEELYSKPRRLVLGSGALINRGLGNPQLPLRYRTTGVDPGE